MSSLKSFLEDDLATFFNESEFGSIHVLDGVETTIVVDEDLAGERKNKRVSDERFERVNQQQKIIYVRDSLYDEPQVEQMIELDGEFFIVKECRKSAGMLEITIEANV